MTEPDNHLAVLRELIDNFPQPQAHLLLEMITASDDEGMVALLSRARIADGALQVAGPHIEEFLEPPEGVGSDYPDTPEGRLGELRARRIDNIPPTTELPATTRSDSPSIKEINTLAREIANKLLPAAQLKHLMVENLLCDIRLAYDAVEGIAEATNPNTEHGQARGWSRPQIGPDWPTDPPAQGTDGPRRLLN